MNQQSQRILDSLQEADCCHNVFLALWEVPDENLENIQAMIKFILSNRHLEE
jgi:hypothetical protein